MDNVKISFIGDLVLPKTNENKVNPFNNVKNILHNADYVVANLEAVCEGFEGENLNKSPRLKISQESLIKIEELNIGLVTLANNHVYDNLFDGFNKTIEFLDEKSIDYIGAAAENTNGKKYLIKNFNNKLIAFLNYVHADTNPNLPLDTKIVLNQYNKKDIIADIEEINRQADYICLIMHWGIDNSAYPAPWQRKDAKDFINAGADLIVGHHSHTLQGYELINKKPVFYNLGNFYFATSDTNNQMYEIDQNRHSKSIILNISLDDNLNCEFKLIPTIFINGSIELASEFALNRICRLNFFLPYINIFWPLYRVYLNYFYKFYFYFFGNNRNPIKRFMQIDRRRLKRLIEIIRMK